MYAEQVEDLEEYNLRKSSCLHFMGVNTVMFCLWVQLGHVQMNLYLRILGILKDFCQKYPWALMCQFYCHEQFKL